MSESSDPLKDRVNIRYRSDVGGKTEEVELPLRILLLGDFTGRPDETEISEREPTPLNKENFASVMKSQGLRVNVTVPNRIAADGSDLEVDMRIDGLRDFQPEGIVDQVAELRELRELREALQTLRRAARNVPAFTKRIQSILKDSEKRTALLRELGIEDDV